MFNQLHSLLYTLLESQVSEVQSPNGNGSVDDGPQHMVWEPHFVEE